MRKLFLTMAVSLFVLSSSAQSSKIEGSWIMLKPDRSGVQPLLKNFLPNGKILGISFSQDMRNQSPWIMGTYEVLNDSVFFEHDDFHSTIAYQRDFRFDYHFESDSILITHYLDRQPNAQERSVTEAWKKVEYIVGDVLSRWDEVKLQALAAFGRVAPEGKTVEQFGDELYEQHQNYKKQNDLDGAVGILMVRAEADTTNLKWQRDLVDYLIELKALPAVADRYANRMVRLSEQLAPTPTDTSVVSAYRGRGILFGNAAFVKPEYAKQALSDLTKSIDLTKASGRPYTKSDGVSCILVSYIYFTQEKYKEAMEYSNQSINIFESDATVTAKQRGEAYFQKGLILAGEEKNREAIDVLLQKTAPFFVDEQGKPMPKMEMEIYPLVFSLYGRMLDKEPKNKKLVKEYRQFTADKLLCGLVMSNTGKAHEAGLEGEYYVMEAGDWNVESLNKIERGCEHFVLQKDGKHIEIDLEEDQELGAQMVVKTVDPSYKQQIIKLWKNYKKNK